MTQPKPSVAGYIIRETVRSTQIRRPATALDEDEVRPTYRPAGTRLDDSRRYHFISETIGDHRRPDKRKMVALCHECMNSPVVESSAGGVRCEFCDHRRKRRMTAAKSAKGA